MRNMWYEPSTGAWVQCPTKKGIPGTSGLTYLNALAPERKNPDWANHPGVIVFKCWCTRVLSGLREIFLQSYIRLGEGVCPITNVR